MTVQVPKILLGRSMGSSAQLEIAQTLNNTLCPAFSLPTLAGKSGHLQRWHFSYGLATLLALENSFSAMPRIAIEPAAVQGGRGTRLNPYAHVLPCGLQANGQSWHTLFKSPGAVTEVRRTFGLGVMAAEEDWEDEVDPSVLNVSDRVVEKHHSQIGLCEAFRRTFEDAAGQLDWQGSGFRLPDVERAAARLKQIDVDLWGPRMAAAYEEEIVRQSEKLGRLAPDGAKYAKVRARIQVLRWKLAAAQAADVNHLYVVGRVFGTMADERAARGLK